MKIRMILLGSGMALTLAACGGGGTQTNTTTTATTAEVENVTTPVATPAATSPAQQFADTAAASDAFEIETSRLALTNASSAAVKSYSQKMIDAHTAATAKLKTAAAAATPAITPAATLSADQQQKLDSLRALNGAAFDKAYVAEQTAGHQQTLDALKAYAATGEVAPLKSFAAEMVPTVTAHLNMAKGMKA